MIIPYPKIIQHIDFLISYQDKYKTRGYWFIISICGPNAITVWVKLSNGIWRCDQPRHPNHFDENLYNPNLQIGPNGYGFAKGEFATYLNQKVCNYMADNGIPFVYPYVYPINQNGTESERY